MSELYVIVQMDKDTYEATESDMAYPEEIARKLAKEMEQSDFYNPNGQYWFHIRQIA